MKVLNETILTKTLLKLFDASGDVYSNEAAEMYGKMLNIFLSPFGWVCHLNADYLSISNSEKNLSLVIGDLSEGDEDNLENEIVIVQYGHELVEHILA
jgi:hypothetical protein